jgi:hypothetical protein
MARFLRRDRATTARSLTSALLCGGIALIADQLCSRFKQDGARRPEAVADALAHLATGLAVALPATPHVRDPERFLATAAISAMFIDLDHIVAARSIKLHSTMTMPNRPASHSVLAIGSLAYLTERLQPGRQTELAVTLGLGSHLLRDLVTGGAPLFMPRHIVAIQKHRGLIMMVALAISGRWYVRRIHDPDRTRRSNPLVLAPEALVAGARAVRSTRSTSRAA